MSSILRPLFRVTIDCSLSLWCEFECNPFSPFSFSQLNTIGIAGVARESAEKSSWIDQQVDETRAIGFRWQWDRRAAAASRQLAVPSRAVAWPQPTSKVARGNRKLAKSCLSWRIRKPTRRNSWRHQRTGELNWSAFIAEPSRVFAKRYSKVDKTDNP